MDSLRLEKYAKALLKVGVNVQPGETVLVETDTNGLELAREIARQGYAMGAKSVVVKAVDPEIQHIQALNESPEALIVLPDWERENLDFYLRDPKTCHIVIWPSYPTLNNDVPDEQMMAQSHARNELRNVARKHLHAGTLKWVGSVYPNMNWAKAVYPELSDEEAFKHLEDDLCAMMYVDAESDPIENWNKHCANLSARSKWLNDHNFKTLHFTSELGTDITMDLVEGHIWEGANDMGESNLDPYVANMPTQEVFTDPDYRTVNGIAYASFPLMISGKLVKDFWICFENGRAVDCGASQNVEFLKNVLYENERTRYLGEVALVSKQSPIRQMNRVYFNGLIDENAACHLAFGQSFASNIKNGSTMSEEELLAHGVNNANSHHDFMVGTEELKVVGIKHDGTEVVIMEHGDFTMN